MVALKWWEMKKSDATKVQNVGDVVFDLCHKAILFILKIKKRWNNNKTERVKQTAWVFING